MKPHLAVLVAALVSSCSQYVSALRRDERTNQVVGGIMRYPQGFQDDMARDQAAAWQEAHVLCGENKVAERVRGFDGVGVYGIAGGPTSHTNSEFFEFKCVEMKQVTTVPSSPRKASEPVCSEADREERRKAGMSASAIEQACQ